MVKIWTFLYSIKLSTGLSISDDTEINSAPVSEVRKLLEFNQE